MKDKLDRLDELEAQLVAMHKRKEDLVKEYIQAKKAEMIKEEYGHYYMLTPQPGRYAHYMLHRDDSKFEIDGPIMRIRKWCERKSINQEQILIAEK